MVLLGSTVSFSVVSRDSSGDPTVLLILLQLMNFVLRIPLPFQGVYGNPVGLCTRGRYLILPGKRLGSLFLYNTII